MILGTLNPPMCGEYFAQTPLYCLNHFDQKEQSLMINNSYKYLANLWELILINLGKI